MSDRSVILIIAVLVVFHLYLRRRRLVGNRNRISCFTRFFTWIRSRIGIRNHRRNHVRANGSWLQRMRQRWEQIRAICSRNVRSRSRAASTPSTSSRSGRGGAPLPDSSRIPSALPHTGPSSAPLAGGSRAQEKTETGCMIYFANTGNRRADKEYRFNYKKVGGSWRAYILRMPNLNGRDSGGAATHRLWDGNQHYICWNTAVTSLKDMQTISRVWADNIQEYIATGRRFGPH